MGSLTKLNGQGFGFESWSEEPRLSKDSSPWDQNSNPDQDLNNHWTIQWHDAPQSSSWSQGKCGSIEIWKVVLNWGKTWRPGAEPSAEPEVLGQGPGFQGLCKVRWYQDHTSTFLISADFGGEIWQQIWPYDWWASFYLIVWDRTILSPWAKLYTTKCRGRLHGFPTISRGAHTIDE